MTAGAPRLLVWEATVGALLIDPDRLGVHHWRPDPATEEVAVALTAETLRTAMGGALPLDRYRQLLPGFASAMVAARCTTVNRAAMWCAQLGHESGGLRWMQEIASGDAYEGRRDLGNTQRGDGRRFKGHGPIQITGRANHTAVSKWAHANGYVPSPTYFVDRPDELASDRFGFLGAVWYWTVARPGINAMCDAGDLTGVTKAINGGTNGLADRRARWDTCRRLGAALLPDGATAPAAPAPQPGRPVLREGDSSELIWRVQKFMNSNFGAYSNINAGDRPPSRLGPQTVAVLTEFQRRSGIPTAPPFEFGPKSWAALESHGFR